MRIENSTDSREKLRKVEKLSKGNMISNLLRWSEEDIL